MNNDRAVGNRRSEEELENLKIKQAKTIYKLEEQENFIGTKEQLELMQNIERAYIDGSPLCTDDEWEILKRRHNYKETLMSISPSGRKWVKFDTPLPSLDKGGSLEDINNYVNRMPKDSKFIVEIKLDGLPGNLRYKLDKNNNLYKLETIASKGNGRFGLKLNDYALSGVKMNIPFEIEKDKIKNFIGSTPNYFEIRGEAVIPKNENTYKKYGKDSVWRNIASGMFNRIVPFNLKGVIEYITDGKETLSSLCDNENKNYVFEPKFEGRRCITPDIYNNMKLIASLYEDKKGYIPPKKGDKLLIDKIDNDICIVTIEYSNGNQITFNNDDDNNEQLDFIMYSMSFNESNMDLIDYSYENNKFDELYNLGFKTIDKVEFMKNYKEQLNNAGYGTTFRITGDMNEIYRAVNDFYGIDPETNKRCTEYPRLRNMYEYACDGVVIKLLGSNKETQKVDLRNSKNNPNKIIQPKYPEDAIAIKLLSEVVKVKLDHIEYNETKLGNVTCTGVLDKGYRTESGAVVSRVNLHNPEWLKENSWIKEGGKYDLIMSLDIIPVLMNPNL